jgi:hypothetical protein
MVRNHYDEAKLHLAKVFAIITEIRKLEQDGEKMDQTQPMPSLDFRMHTSRLLIELEEFKKAVKVLDSII